MKRLYKTASAYFPKDGNFITPHIISYEYVGDWVVELSVGEFFTRVPLYGVTVANAYTGERIKHNLSKCFIPKWEAMEHIKSLKNIKGRE